MKLRSHSLAICTMILLWTAPFNHPQRIEGKSRTRLKVLSEGDQGY